MAFFPTQPNYFKIGMSYDLYNRTRSNTYRTAFGKPPYFTFWIDNKCNKEDSINLSEILERRNRYTPSLSVQKILENRENNNPNNLLSVERTVLRAMKEKYIPGNCGVEVFERGGKNDCEIESDISDILKNNTIAYIKQRYRIE